MKSTSVVTISDRYADTSEVYLAEGMPEEVLAEIVNHMRAEGFVVGSTRMEAKGFFETVHAEFEGLSEGRPALLAVHVGLRPHHPPKAIAEIVIENWIS